MNKDNLGNFEIEDLSENKSGPRVAAASAESCREQWGRKHGWETIITRIIIITKTTVIIVISSIIITIMIIIRRPRRQPRKWFAGSGPSQPWVLKRWSLGSFLWQPSEALSDLFDGSSWRGVKPWEPPPIGKLLPIENNLVGLKVL